MEDHLETHPKLRRVMENKRCNNCNEDMVKDNKYHLCEDCLVVCLTNALDVKTIEYCPRFIKSYETLVEETNDPDTSNKSIHTKESYNYRKCNSSCSYYRYKPACFSAKD